MTASTPRRRHSPAVYRRRRLLVLITLLVVGAVVVWLLVAQPWRGAASESPSPQAQQSTDASPLPVPSSGATPTSTPTPGATAGATPTPTGTPAATVDVCSSRDVTVEAVTDKNSYSSDQQPAFSIRLTNNGSTDCTMNVGTTTQVYTVTSGNDTWWRSTDCQNEPSDMIVTLAAGQSVASAAPLVWDRTRSDVGTCGQDSRPRAPGGGASYHLAVEIGGVGSEQTTQFLLY